MIINQPPITADNAAVAAAQLVTDQAAALAAAANIKLGSSILAQDGTYDFEAAIAAGYVDGLAAQLATDEYDVSQAVNEILSGVWVLHTQGNYVVVIDSDIKRGVTFGPNGALTGTAPAVLTSVANPPSDGVGANGDMCFVSADGVWHANAVLYYKSAGAWQLSG